MILHTLYPLLQQGLSFILKNIRIVLTERNSGQRKNAARVKPFKINYMSGIRIKIFIDQNPLLTVMSNEEWIPIETQINDFFQKYVTKFIDLKISGNAFILIYN